MRGRGRESLGRLLRAGVIFAAAAGALPAQVVRGTIADERGAPIRGAVVALLSSDGRPTDRRTLTSDAGTFALGAPAPGSFRLDVRAIGYVRRREASFTLGVGEARVVDLVLRPITTRLTTVRIPGRGSCRRAEDLDPVAAEVWDEVWAALTATVIAREQALVRTNVLVYSRELDAQAELVRSEERTIHSTVTGRPFRAASAGDLARFGFRRESDDGSTSTYFAPDAQTLVAPEFLTSHCFALTRRDSAGQVRIGLTFRPQQARAPNDVSGVLWIDPGSRELRTLDFTYTELPDGERRRLGGRVSFTRLPTGVWVDEGWSIRAPVLRRFIRGDQRFGGLRLAGESRDSVLSIHEEGGFVLSDSTRSRRFARLQGRITPRSDSPLPVRGTQVQLLGTALRDTADSGGSYSVGEVLPGKYEIRIHRSGRGDEGAFVQHRTLEARAGTVATLAVEVPSDTASATALCPGSSLRKQIAPVFAVVRDARSSRPVPNRVLELEWSGWEITTRPLAVKQRFEKRNVTTDWRGEFVFCDLPERRDVRFRDTQTTLPEWSPPVRAGFRLLIVDLLIDPATGAVAWQTADSSSVVVQRASPNDPPTRRARLAGTVGPADSGAVRLPDVQVRIEATSLTTRTDAQGEFRFDSVPDGWYEVSARRPGFAPFSSALLFRAGEATQLRIRLERVRAELAEVRVEERSPLSIAMIGFEQRRAARIGKFIGPEVLDKYTGPTLSGLIGNKIPGFDLVPLITRGYISGGFGIASKRYVLLRGRTQDAICFAKVMVNGVKLGGGGNESPLNIDELRPAEVVGMEFYRGASEVPTEFSGPDAACGVVVIWTKQR